VPSVDYDLTVPYRNWAGRPVLRPLLRVIVHFLPHAAPPLLVIVDSGADVSLFHVDVVIRAGIDLSHYRTTGTLGVGGVATSYVVPVELDVLGKRFPADVRFTDAVSPTTALLGREDVFEQFQFGFDQRSRQFHVKSYS
jgi:hypothetical protein